MLALVPLRSVVWGSQTMDTVSGIENEFKARCSFFSTTPSTYSCAGYIVDKDAGEKSKT